MIGNWTGSDIVASARAGADALFGTADDVLLAGGDATIAAIARINIKGAVAGTAAAGDHFGFVAEELGTVKIAGALLPLQIGPQNNPAGLALGGSADARAREVKA